MLKKIMIATLAALVVTAVGAAAYNTTIKPALQQSAPQVASAQEAAPVVSQTQNQAQQVRGGGNGPGSSAANGQPLAAASTGASAALSANPAQAGAGGQGRGNRFGGGGQGRQNQTGSTDGSAIPAPQNGLTEWISLEGTVSQIAYPTFQLTTSDGQTVLVSLGNLNYVANLGIDLSDGEYVSVVGFWDTDGTFAVGSLTADGSIYTLRDDYGRPLWSGGASH
jgi:hypothetical protein